MRLSRLLTLTANQQARLLGPDTEISALTADSRAVTLGSLFAALTGTHTQGSRYMAQAIVAGASAILHDGTTQLKGDLPQIIHPTPRRLLAELAAAFFGHPANGLTMIAVTGSNGKTTVAAMVEAILTASGLTTGVIGTTGMRHSGIQLAPSLTTPDPITLQQTIRTMADQGVKAVVVEVSSHALTQFRTAGIRWDAAAFTNLSRDHLDYHGTMEHYWQAKSHLFLDAPHPKAAIINADDPKGNELTQMVVKQGIKWSRFAIEKQESVDYFTRNIHSTWQQSNFTLHTPSNTLPITLHAAGRVNIANALTATALCDTLGIDPEAITRGLNQFRPVHGRMDPINAGQPFTVLIDFAHTPDALKRLLLTAQEITPTSRRILVFGCGGERDAGKRGIMGSIAGELAHHTILTDDNPRSEDPDQIRLDIKAGLNERRATYTEIPARDQAIAYALELAQANDVIMIAGKGHETVQITATGHHPFNDAQIARDHLAHLGFKDN